MALRYTHAQIITLLFAFFSRFCSFPLLGSAFTLAASDTSMPEPDFAVFATETPTLTERGYVRPGDVRLVVEVSDATLPHDTTEKVTLYARAGIAEY